MTILGRRIAVGAVCSGLLVAASLFGALQAWAHTRSVSYSSWVLDPQGATVTLLVTQLELTRLPWGPAWGAELDPDLASYLTDRLQLLSGGEPCAVADGPRILASRRYHPA